MRASLGRQSRGRMWPEATVGVEVPTVEENVDGTGGQAVEEARSEVSEHRGVEAKLVAVSCSVLCHTQVFPAPACVQARALQL
jgi:hypothetical protein